MKTIFDLLKRLVDGFKKPELRKIPVKISKRMKPFASILLLMGTVSFVGAVQTVQAQQGYSSMYSDSRAQQTGDIITIILAERTSASRSSSWRNNTSATSGAGGSVNAGTAFTGRFGADAQFRAQNDNMNESLQRDLLSGTIAATIVGADSLGNLIVQGRRVLSINDETHSLTVEGSIRTYDVRFDNSLMSYQIANAVITYERLEKHTRFFKPGFFARAAATLALVAAAVIAVLVKTDSGTN